MPDREMLERLRQAKFDDERAHLIRVRNDILWFCDAAQRLLTQIRMWMHGYAISLLPSVICFTDKSISLWPDSTPICYEICTLSLKKYRVTAELVPLGVYGESGTRGQLSLIIMNPDGQPTRLEYRLTLDRVTSCWAIRSENELKHIKTPLNKDTFRTAITPLRQSKKRYSQ